MTTRDRRDFLINQLPSMLETLSAESKGNFGLMTSQHMVEHLIKSIKSASKKYEGAREIPANERQLGFQKFIAKGSILKHRPSDKTKADLPPLKYGSIEEAISIVPESTQRFYDFWDENEDYIPYGSFIGELSFEKLELFHYMHCRYHLWQFNLIESYP